MTPITDPTSDTVTQAGALKAAVRYVRGELNEKLDEIETSLERAINAGCSICGMPADQGAYLPCVMTPDRKHRFAGEIRLKEPA